MRKMNFLFNITFLTAAFFVSRTAIANQIPPAYKIYSTYSAFGPPVTFSTEAEAAANCATLANAAVCNSANYGVNYGPTTFSYQTVFSKDDGTVLWAFQCRQSLCKYPDPPVVDANSRLYYFNTLDPYGLKSDLKCEGKAKGSDINIDAKTLGERIELVGSPLGLVYNTALHPGFRQRYSLGAYPQMTDPTTYPKIRIKTKDYSTGALLDSQDFTGNADYNFYWDGTDSVGNHVRERDFTLETFDVDGSNVETLRDSQSYSLAVYDAITAGLGDWLPEDYAFLDVSNDVITFADGREVGVHPKYYQGWLVSSEDGSKVYNFSTSGILSKIVSGLTGSTIYSFTYNSYGLSTITDGYGDLRPEI